MALMVLALHLLPAKQPVLISFDSYPIPESLDFTRRHKVPFTYFISATDFITFVQVTNATNLPWYHAQGFRLMEVRIPWAKDDATVSNRWEWIVQALALSNEIGGHAVGHFDGGGWDDAGWRTEFKDFQRYLKYSKDRHKPDLDLKITGFRAPLLGLNRSLYRILPEFGYEYDASYNHFRNICFTTNQGLLLIPIHYLSLAGSKATVLAMDYNFYMYQSRGNPETDPKRLLELQNQVFQSYQQHFLRWYSPSNRQPISYANHLTPFNQWIYWKALIDFIVWAGQYEVEFLTHREYGARYWGIGVTNHVSSNTTASVAVSNQGTAAPSAPKPVAPIPPPNPVAKSNARPVTNTPGPARTDPVGAEGTRPKSQGNP